MSDTMSEIERAEEEAFGTGWIGALKVGDEVAHVGAGSYETPVFTTVAAITKSGRIRTADRREFYPNGYERAPSEYAWRHTLVRITPKMREEAEQRKLAEWVRSKNPAWFTLATLQTVVATMRAEIEARKGEAKK